LAKGACINLAQEVVIGRSPFLAGARLQVRKGHTAAAIGCEWCAPAARNWCSKSVKMAGSHGKSPHRAKGIAASCASAELYYFLQVAHSFVY
jgi:hypothetical protein